MSDTKKSNAWLVIAILLAGFLAVAIFSALDSFKTISQVLDELNIK